MYYMAFLIFLCMHIYYNIYVVYYANELKDIEIIKESDDVNYKDKFNEILSKKDLRNRYIHYVLSGVPSFLFFYISCILIYSSIIGEHISVVANSLILLIIFSIIYCIFGEIYTGNSYYNKIKRNVILGNFGILTMICWIYVNV